MNINDTRAIEEGCYFDEGKANKAIRFIQSYSRPSTIGKLITLLPWQSTVVKNLFGWYRPDGSFRFRAATISTSKKQGKTLLISSLLSYGLLGNLFPSSFVASASTSRENASQVYRELAYSIRSNPKTNKLCDCRDSFKEIRCKSKNSRYRAFSSDAGSSEGENIAFAAIDETHAHQSAKLYRSLQYSTIARKGMFINISTAGSDQGHFFYEVFKYAQGVQNSSIIDTSIYSFV